jgi:hypothetical protein
MNRSFVCVVLLTVVTATALFGAEPAPQVPAIQLVVQPAAAPSPALKYRLLPELRDTTPGNAVQFYYRAFSPEWQFYRHDHKAHLKLHEAVEAPLKDVPRDDVGWVATSKMLKEVDRAARKQHCDWNLTERMREEGASVLLPDIQSMREFAALLKLRAKLELLDGRHDKVAYTLQTGLAMGRHTAEGPCLIECLVGLAICNIMLGEIEEWIQQPSAPNLYWALTDLPRPLVPLKKPFQGERIMLDAYLPGYREMLANPKAAPHSREQVEEHVDKLLPLFEDRNFERLQFVAIVLRGYEEAKKFLIARGRTAEDVEAIPAMQVVLLHQVAKYDELFDEMYKYTTLPFPEGRTGLRDFEKKMKEMAQDSSGQGRSLAYLFLPTVTKVYSAHARTDRKVAALRCVEALRLYAATHDGKLPAKLADVKEVPIPLDTYTGKAFEYEYDGKKATLTGPNPDDEPATLSNYLRYEVTIKK